jgi:undecaprenyl-diphosphatase
MTYAEAMVVGLIQGVTELFPVSSLGHNVLIPALIGGSWASDLNVSKAESPYLAFIVGLHVATAAAMILYFWRDWLRIIKGFFSSLAERRVATADQKLAWMIILATIPVGISGLLLEHAFRVFFSKPVPTAIFLAVNGVVLLGGERLRRRSGVSRRSVPVTVAQPTAAARYAGVAETAVAGATQARLGDPVAAPHAAAAGADRPVPATHKAERQAEIDRAIAADARLSGMGFGQAVLIGAAQIFALLPGISRDGMVTVTGMFRGISRQDAVRYSFLLSAPVILAAGLLKVPDLTGPLGKGIHGPIVVGSLLSFIGAYFSVRFLTRYFAKERSLAPFGIYCLIAGLGSLLVLVLR